MCGEEEYGRGGEAWTGGSYRFCPFPSSCFPPLVACLWPFLHSGTLSLILASVGVFSSSVLLRSWYCSFVLLLSLLAAVLLLHFLLLLLPLLEHTVLLATASFFFSFLFFSFEGDCPEAMKIPFFILKQFGEGENSYFLCVFAMR